MSIKKAIAKLQEILYCGFSDNLPEGKERNNAIKLAIQSLQKQLDTPLTDVYPYNLALCICGDEANAVDLSVYGISDVLFTLTERERRVILSRFKDKLSLEKVAIANNVTRERIRQIEAKALRKLRHPSRIAKMRAYTYADVIKNAEERNELRHENTELKKVLRMYTNKKIDKSELLALTQAADVSLLNIEELELSIRSFNCLKRKGVNTVGDLLGLTISDLQTIRNLGQKSMSEILSALDKRGLKLKEVT